MSKKMLINVMHPEEARVAIVEDGRLVELDIEIAGSEQTRGNVYKGVVVRVEPGLQAAFVDIGLKKLGFLQMGELHPDYWQWRDDIPEEQRKRRPRIQEVLRRGQELIVQVEKGERDMKGAALTTYLSFPGRYMVVMPGSDSAGVSRKVESEGDRKKLKEMAAEMKIPEGIGYIIRTEALGKTKTELNKDLKSLLKLNQEILAKAKKAKAPALIYQELDLVIRTIRDYFTAEIDEVLVDNPEVYEQARAFFKVTMPKLEKMVKLHQEKRPIFSKYQLEEQIDQIYEKKVPLKSGGSLVIEPTEALVSIDVNSGKSTGEKGVEDTAFKTNMEAAEEAARQLRLRDLGGADRHRLHRHAGQEAHDRGGEDAQERPQDGQGAGHRRPDLPVRHARDVATEDQADARAGELPGMPPLQRAGQGEIGGEHGPLLSAQGACLGRQGDTCRRCAGGSLSKWPTTCSTGRSGNWRRSRTTTRSR